MSKFKRLFDAGAAETRAMVEMRKKAKLQRTLRKKAARQAQQRVARTRKTYNAYDLSLHLGQKEKAKVQASVVALFDAVAESFYTFGGTRSAFLTFKMLEWIMAELIARKDTIQGRALLKQLTEIDFSTWEVFGINTDDLRQAWIEADLMARGK